MLTIQATGVPKLKKDLQDLGEKVELITRTNVLEAVKTFQFSFDASESIPYSTGTTGQIVASIVDGSETAVISAILPLEAQKITQTIVEGLLRDIKEVLK